MVHRPADSRLLTNLLSHEKDYSKHLSILLDYSQAALSSFSAYAAASAPPTSQVIIAVAGALAGADDALRSYAAAVDQWQEQLKALKAMEDEVANIMRDREILVTRLIKASKQHKPTRDSVLGSSPSGSSLNITKPEVQVGHKLSAAQAQLQACEAHLAAKEQELNAFRTHTIKSGLQARCKSMVECGWAWGEMGKEGMRALETLAMSDGHGSPSMHPDFHQKPLPGYEKPPSDVSSIAPSQSASQIGHSSSPPGTVVEPTWRASSPSPVPTPSKPYTLQIPPAHSISDFVVLNGTANPTIVEEEGGSSAEEEEEAPVEVHENPRFSKGKNKAMPVPSLPASAHVSFSVRGPKSSPSDAQLPASYSLRGDSPSKKRGRTGSVLGGLAALFHVGNSRKESGNSPNVSPVKPAGRWQTRIDKNLAAARRGDDSSDDEVAHSYAGPSSPRQPVELDSTGWRRTGGENTDARLKKRFMKRGSVQAQSPVRIAADTDKGYASDTITESISKARAKSSKSRSPAKRTTVDGFGGSVRVPNGNVAGSPTGGRLKKSPAVAAVFVAEGGPSLSRNSSISKQSVTSTASAPPRTKAVAQTNLGRQNSHSRKRTASLDVPASPSAGPSTPTSHKRTLSSSTSASTPTRTLLTNGEPSLMSIVEGLSRMNKEAALKQDPSRLLVVPKAPGPINIAYSESIGELPVVMTSPQSEREGSPVRRERPRNAKGKEPEENNYRNSLLLSASVSAPTLPLNGDARATSFSQSKPLPSHPVKLPLRSALRNPSRTPSPSVSPARPIIELERNGSPSSSTVKAAPVVSPKPVSASVVAAALSAEASKQNRQENDNASISSYETGHEDFDTPLASPVSPATPPPTAAAPGSKSEAPLPQPPNGHIPDGSELSHSTDSTVQMGGSGDHPPRRRKSVRMSLPPTFSATPPAVEDTDEDDGQGRSAHAPWSSPGGGSMVPSSWGTRIEENSARDVWQDSSDEEAEYSAAKRMLARVSRKA